MIKSYSKVNLFLKVLSKNKKGLHNIQTLSVLTSLHDQIEIKKINNNKDQINFLGNFKKDISKTNNSATKTLQILRDYKFINKQDHFEINIYKNIPVFAGLGGGTSNAYFIARHFIKKKFNEKLIKVFENKIGSDFRLFFYKNSIQKRLKKIYKLNIKKNIFLLLVYPNEKCSTREVYKKVKRYSSPLSFNNIKHEYISFLKKQKNDLQTIVEKKYTKIKNLLTEIQNQNNCIFSRMTGSGSVCFGIFLYKKHAYTAQKQIKKKYPKYLSIVTKSL